MRCQPRALLAAGLLLLASAARSQSWQSGPTFPEAPSPRLQAAGLYWNYQLWAVGGSPFSATSDSDGTSDYLNFGDPTFTDAGYLNGHLISQGAGVDALGRAVVFGGWVGPDGDRGGTFQLGAAGVLPSRSATAPPANFSWTTDFKSRIYSIGGGPGDAATTGTPNSTRVERFDALLNAWEVIAPLPVALSNAASAEDGYGHVLVIGGLDATAATRLSSVLSLDIASGTWAASAFPPLPSAVSNARAILAPDQRIYVIGGYTGPVHARVPSANVWVLDLRTNIWNAGPSLSTPRADPAVAYVPGYASIFAMCGDDGAGGNYTTEMLAVQTCPAFVTPALPETLCVGRTAGFQVEAAGDAPIALQWRKNGFPIADGPTGTGSIVGGATTSLLEIRQIGLSDAGMYDAVAVNACGSRTAASAALVITSGPALPAAPDWTVTQANFSPHTTQLSSIFGGLAGGSYDAVGYNNGYYFHGFTWDGKPADPPIQEPNSAFGSSVFEMAGPLNVGYRQWLFSTSRGAHYVYTQGEVWASVGGTTTSTTLATGIALGTDGVQIVGGSAGATGSSGAAAILWTAPSPAGPWTSHAIGQGYATSCLNGRQFGQSNGHAAVWPGGYLATDLNPPGASSSVLKGAWGQDQGGDFVTTSRRAGLWHGRPYGVTDLTPNGADSAGVNRIRNLYQVGHADIAGDSRASIWGSGPALWTDLGQVAGPAYTATVARDVEVDSLGNLTVVGSGVRIADGATVGLFWQSWPYAVIIQQPVPVTANVGQDASFAVLARGNGGLSYQWRHDGAPLSDDGRITGTRSSVLHIAHSQDLDRGLYDVRVSNPLRTLFSQAESLTVLFPVGVDANPIVTRFLGVSPLPASQDATVRFQLARRSQVNLRMYDLSGRLVRTVANEVMASGEHKLHWDTRGGHSGSSGVYFLRFEADGVSVTKKVVVIR